MSAHPLPTPPSHRPSSVNVPVYAAIAAFVFIAFIVAGTFPHAPW